MSKFFFLFLAIVFNNSILNANAIIVPDEILNALYQMQSYNKVEFVSECTAAWFKPKPSTYTGILTYKADGEKWIYKVSKIQDGIEQIQYICAFDGKAFQTYDASKDTLFISKKEQFPYAWFGRSDVSPLSIMGFLNSDFQSGLPDTVYAANWNQIINPNSWKVLWDKAQCLRLPQGNQYSILGSNNVFFNKGCSHYSILFNTRNSIWPASLSMSRDGVNIDTQIRLVDLQDLNVADKIHFKFPKKIVAESINSNSGALIVRDSYLIKSVTFPMKVEPSNFVLNPQMANSVVDLDENIAIKTGK